MNDFKNYTFYHPRVVQRVDTSHLVKKLANLVEKKPLNSSKNQNGLFWAILGSDGTGRKSSNWILWALRNCFQFSNPQASARHPQTPPRHHPDTTRHHPDTTRHHPDTPTHRRFYALEVTRITMQYLSVMTKYDFYWIASIPDSIQSHPNTLQTPSRHPPNTPQTPQNLVPFGCGRKDNILIWRLLFNFLWFIWHLYSPRHLLDTPRYDPDTVGDPQTPSRHSPDIF